MWLKRKKKKALVLSGGSARGIAHLGAIRVLKREGIEFDLVVGTSIGALVGAAYCLDRSLDEIEQMALRITATDLLDVTISRMGLTEGNKLENIIREIVGDKTFKDMKVPLAVTAIDVEAGLDVYFTEGEDLVKTIKASCSLPGIFKPVEFDGKLLIDGGMRQHLPTEIAKKLGADFIVAVDVGFCVKKGKINSMLGVIMQSIQIMGQELSAGQAKKADILICPQLGNDIDQLAFNQAAFIIEKGKEATEKALPELKKYVGGH
ncbi:MAG: patatin-like phospholipase family protein [Candidatus Omnitrophica bacterium]|nr:patatin-like phospholipase family protein [Candidatus Omnitrophota bacterium]